LNNDVNAATLDLSIYDIPDTRKYTKMERFWMKHLSFLGLANFSWKIVRFIILVGLSFVILLPFFVSVVESFKSFHDFIDPTVQFIPKNATWEHINNIMHQIGGMRLDFAVIPRHIGMLLSSGDILPRYYTNPNLEGFIGNSFLRNSFFITFWYSGLIALIQVVVCALAGYGFARFKFVGSNILFFCVILSLIIPPQTLMIPMFIRFRFFFPIGSEEVWGTIQQMNYYTGAYETVDALVNQTVHLNLINTHWPGIILAATGLGIKNGLYIFMFRQFFKNMPKELEEASYIDGCNTFQTFFKIMLPSAVALMVTVFLLSFAWQWTDTTFSTLYMRRFGLLANMMSFVFYRDPEVHIMQAMYFSTAAILAIIPVALVYFVGQRFFIQSVERSGITG